MTYRILHGDVLDRLRELPDEHFHCCCTSPPYWGLRRYLPEGHPDEDAQIGMEATPEEYVERMVVVFREVRRVLRGDGTFWLNCGDVYAANRTYQVPDQKWSDVGNAHGSTVPVGLKPKDLIGIPWRLVLALQNDGWWWRSCIAWTKRSAMPESVRDRPPSAWEPIFLLTKAAKYFYDAEAVRQKDKDTDHARSVLSGQPSLAPPGQPPNTGIRTSEGRNGAGASLRNVWPIEPEDYTEWNLGPDPFPGAHFAVFPTEIPRRAILAGTSAKGCCPECGKPWERETDVTYDNPGNRTTNGPRNLDRQHDSAAFKVRLERRSTTVGWRPACDHGLNPVPCRVLDPFGGAMTTAVVAEELGRDSTMIELSAEYCAMGEKRIQASLSVTRRRPGPSPADLPLFAKGER